MRLFLDSSVLLAACASPTGASREVFRLAPNQGWNLVATPYVLEEVIHNLPDFPVTTSAQWAELQPDLLVFPDVVTCDLPVIFRAGKDRPVLFGALAWADVLLTLDRADFGDLLGKTFYAMPVLKPGTFLERERTAGRVIA